MKAVLFDFGGTIDTGGVHWSEKFWEWYEKLNIPVGKKVYERAFVASDDALLYHPEIGSATFFVTLKLQIAGQFRLLGLTDERLLHSLLDAVYNDVQQIIGGAAALLDYLHAKYRLGLVSNFYGNLNIVCREFHIDALFDILIDSARVGVRKPDPAIFRLALEGLALQPADAYVVGDSYERDIVPAKTLGCRTIWLKGQSWKEHPKETPAADVVIDKFAQLRSVLL